MPSSYFWTSLWPYLMSSFQTNNPVLEEKNNILSKENTWNMCWQVHEPSPNWVLLLAKSFWSPKPQLHFSAGLPNWRPAGSHTNPNICKNPPDDTWCKLNAKLLPANFSLTIFSLSFSSFFWASCPTDSAPMMTLTRNSFWHNASSQMNFLEDLWSITRHTWRLECLICPHVSSTKHTKHFDASWAAEWICSDMQQVHTDLLPTNMQTAAIPLLLVAFRGIVQMSVSGSRKYAVRVCHIRKFSPPLFKWNPRSDPHYYLLLNTTYYGPGIITYY